MSLVRSLAVAALLLAPAFLSAAVAQPATAPARQSSAAIERDGFRFPERIGSFTRGAVTDFEARAPGLGVGVRYEGATGHADIFVYDKRLNLSTVEIEARLSQERDQAVRDVEAGVRSGNYDRADVVKTAELRLPGGRLQTAEVTLVQKGTKRDSFVLVAAMKNRFVKVRYTAAPSPRAAADGEALIKSFLAAQANP